MPPLNDHEQPPSLRVRESAEKLERHIHACGLKPGDRYITTEEAGRLLGKSAVMAQRAMALLAKRDILERRPKAGTFIGKGVTKDVEIAMVHFLVPEKLLAESVPSDTYWRQIEGMREVIPNLGVQFSFIPNQDLHFTQQVIEKAAISKSLTGVVLMLSSRAIRSYFDSSGIPTVVAGGIEPDLNNLCWIDLDQAQIGRLITAHLLERGHRQIVTIMRDIWSMGEPLLHDGIIETLGSTSLPSGALRIRSLPSERPAIVELTRHLLLHDATPPTAFICRNQFQAECVFHTVESLGLSGKVDVALCSAASEPDNRRFISVIPEIDSLGQGRIIGSMLQGLIDRTAPGQRGHSVGVRLQPLNI